MNKTMKCGNYTVLLHSCGGRIYRCDLESGHGGDHTETSSGNQWTNKLANKQNEEFLKYVGAIGQIEPSL